MKEDARVRMSGALTNLWDGTPLSRVRGNEAGVLAGRRLTVNLMAQPAVAALLLRDPVVAGSDGQGLVNRFLVAEPESTAGTRFFQEPPPEAVETIKIFRRPAVLARTNKP